LNGSISKDHLSRNVKYVGKNGTVYGIDYYADGKKHREIIGALLGGAKKILEERRAQAKRGVVTSGGIPFQVFADF
jgi:hypothetical protein